MEAFVTALGNIWEKYILEPFRQFNFWDALDILLLAVLLYCVYLFFKGRRAGKLAVGLAFVLILYTGSDILGFHATHRILEGIAPFAVILLAVIFQPELRDALEKLGTTPFGFLKVNDKERSDISNTVNEVVDAACRIAMSGEDGALIVIERRTRLGEYADKGQQLDAQVSGNLLCNIFVNRSPLHDGAVIIQGNRIAAAGAKLPLARNEEIVRGMGTRHRAAVGITEISDCVAVVVSEERHQISIANNGLLKRDYHRTADELRSESSMKDIQNSLRNDLFKLLAGEDYDEEKQSKSKNKGKGKGGTGKKKDAAHTGRDRAAERPIAHPVEPIAEEEPDDQLTIEPMLAEQESTVPAETATPVEAETGAQDASDAPSA